MSESLVGIIATQNAEILTLRRQVTELEAKLMKAREFIRDNCYCGCENEDVHGYYSQCEKCQALTQLNNGEVK